VLEHVPEHKKALRQAWSVLRPGGHLLLTVPMADWFKLYKGLAVRSLVKFIDEETHRREWSLVPFQRFTAVRQLLNDLREAGLEPVKSRGIFYGSWRLEKICNRLLDRHPKLFEVAAWLDIQLGSLPGLRWAGRYAIIIARKRQ
jgi:2-polyprenyl-3-methyl-5-hydroxy-6-metoxy-1,4-benzoquinol methylase